MTTLTVTKELQNGVWTITAQISNTTLPTAIFMYENTGTSVLGPYAGVVNFEDIARFQQWAGVAIPTFGNKYVRHTTGVIPVTSDANPDDVITRLTDSVKILKSTFVARSTTTQVITIP